VVNTITLKNRISLLLLAMLFAVFSYFYLDADIALFVRQLLHRNAQLERTLSNIPDLLLHVVLGVTVLCWAGYFLLRGRNVYARDAQFLRACGTVVPLAFLAKVLLQYVFGRPDPHIWLHYHLPPRFSWFRANAGYGCFPSGHMTVFTSLMTTLLHYYPRYRRVIQVLLFLLALALVGTNYHFLSDVIAGACLGAGVAFIVNEKAISGNRSNERT
jgi:membrane-associated phospholipid phosphatase